MKRILFSFLLTFCPCTAMPDNTPMVRFLALGDSYTIGESVDPHDRWPVYLTALLRQKDIPIGEPEIIATTGWTTFELWSGIDAAAPAGPYDLVSLLIGVNNQYRGRSLAEYREQFGSLLKRAIALAGDRPSRVLVLSIPDWGVTPFAAGRDRAAISSAIDAFNSVNREESERQDVYYVDITAISRDVERDLSLIAGDGLHPSGKMYAEWAKLALPAALKAIGQ